MDVKISFLNGDLEEEYMEQSEGFVVKGQKIRCVNWSNLYMG